LDFIKTTFDLEQFSIKWTKNGAARPFLLEAIITSDMWSAATYVLSEEEGNNKFHILIVLTLTATINNNGHAILRQ
jgi:hypothetical protein